MRASEPSERSKQQAASDSELVATGVGVAAKRVASEVCSKRSKQQAKRASRNWCRCCCEASNKRSKQQAKASQSQLVFVLLARFAHSSLGSQLASLASLLED